VKKTFIYRISGEELHDELRREAGLPSGDVSESSNKKKGSWYYPFRVSGDCSGLEVSVEITKYELLEVGRRVGPGWYPKEITIYHIDDEVKFTYNSPSTIIDRSKTIRKLALSLENDRVQEVLMLLLYLVVLVISLLIIAP